MTRELSPSTWPDFVDLFSRGNGWDHCACTYFQRGPGMPKAAGKNRAEREAHNHGQKRALVEEGRAHGILVYDGAAPIGWCQFGRVAELPCGVAPNPGGPDWRVTCFVTDKRYRRAGVASAGLRAALDAIGRRGGGVVEGYPVAGWTRGDGATAGPVDVDGLGPVAPARGTCGFVSTQGTVSMFAAAGFVAVGVMPRDSRLRISALPRESHVIMRRNGPGLPNSHPSLECEPIPLREKNVRQVKICNEPE